MKKTLFVVACAFGLFSVNAVAGGCIHGDGYAKMQDHLSEEVVAEQKPVIDPNLLALWNRLDRRQSPVESIPTFN